jgi:GR25 family glycosyltransferase involved in LPS biosynthesis
MIGSLNSGHPPLEMNFPSIADAFERITCINLERVPERWDRFCKSLEEIGIKKSIVMHFSAIDGILCAPPAWWHAGNGAWGCHQSHVAVLQQAIQAGINSLLVLEDDALFSPNFPQEFSSFFNELPKDWDGIMLGGQHLKSPRHISKRVVRVTNGNRTHAYALRGQYIKAAYQHLCDYPAHSLHPTHHVDHRFGKLHETKRYNIYAPNPWLIGQRAGFSSIRNRDVPQRFWNKWESRFSQSIGNDEKVNIPLASPLVAVLGLYRSGSSSVAGILSHLGFHLGAVLSKANKWNTDGYFEPQWLSRHLRRLCDEPRLQQLAAREQRILLLRQWLNDEARRAGAMNKPVAVKHPLLCMLGSELLDASPIPLKFIAIYRPIEESVASLDRTGWWTPRYRRSVSEQLWNSREGFLRTQEHLKIDYKSLLIDPLQEILRIIQYLGLSPLEVQVENAVRSIKGAIRI